jgi:hypothetical protein
MVATNDGVKECSLCNQSMGVCVQCSDSRCKKTFHVMCARARALLVELKRDNDNSVQFLQCCRTHSMVITSHSLVYSSDTATISTARYQ